MVTLSRQIGSVLYVVFVLFLVIGLRVWHLGVVQREERLKAAYAPQRRTVYVRPNRGTVSDRFGIPLAVNKISHRAVFYYNQLASIPSVIWKEEGGKKVKVLARRDYIHQLALLCQDLFGLDPERTEDLIHAKASLFPHVPFALKDPISEKEYFTLKALEREWPGLYGELSSKRFYPLDKTGCHVVGTIGRIDRSEYDKIATEIQRLEEELYFYENGMERAPLEGFASFEEVSLRLQELKDKAYSLTDWVGKMGIEKQFEERLRGSFGKKSFEVDQKGRILRELPEAKEPIPGEHVTLSLSAELQEFAERLLEDNERVRQGKSRGPDAEGRPTRLQKEPKIRGGAIVALDPRNGEVLALASSPRFDPNDFTNGSPRLSQWLESTSYLGAIWNGTRFFSEEKKEILSWELFLSEILGISSPIHSFFQMVHTVKKAAEVQEDFDALLYYTQLEPLKLLEYLEEEGPSAFTELVEAKEYWQRLEPLLKPLGTPKTRLFALDLCRLALDSTLFSDELLKETGRLTIGAYRGLTQAVLRIEEKILANEKERFHREEFALWKKVHQKDFLADKRKIEKQKGVYPKPYIDLLDEEELKLFQNHWEKERLSLLAQTLLSYTETSEDLRFIQKDLSKHLLEDFIHTCRPFSKLKKRLLTDYAALRGKKGEQTQQHLAMGFYPLGGYGYLRSSAFQTATPLASLFKIITGYEGLRQGLSSFALIDESGFDSQGKEGQKQIVAYGLNKTPYPRVYKGGRLPKSSAAHIGKVDLVGALEQSSNPFFAVLAGDFFADPNDLSKAAKNFGLGEKTGLNLPGETAGQVPEGLEKNRTGLYSLAIGQHTLLTTPLQASLMLAAVANKGDLLIPTVTLSPPAHFDRIKRQLSMGPSFRTPLFEGMHRAVFGPKGNARPEKIQMLLGNPVLLHEYLSLENQFIGKTSTAQIVHRPCPDPSSIAEIYKHIWFGAISFDPKAPLPLPNRFEYPELVVVVFLRFGSGGKEAAPLAAQIVHKWREIKKKYETPP